VELLLFDEETFDCPTTVGDSVEGQSPQLPPI